MRSAEGRPLASALLDVVDGIVIAGKVVTAAGERGKGHGSGRDAVGAGVGVGAGARVAALNVQADNAAALAL